MDELPDTCLKIGDIMQQQTIGEKIRAIRVRSQTKQRELAKHLSVTNSTVSNWENGRRLPSIEELQRIAVFFGISLDVFSSEGAIDSEYVTRPNSESTLIRSDLLTVTLRVHTFPSWLVIVAISLVIGMFSLITSDLTSMFLYYLAVYLLLATAIIRFYQYVVFRNRSTKVFLCPTEEPSLFLPENKTGHVKAKRLILFILFPIETLLAVVAFIFFFLSNESSGSLPIELSMMVFAFISFYVHFHRFKRYICYSPFKSMVSLRKDEKNRMITPYLYPVIVSVMLFVLMITQDAFDLFWLPELHTIHILVIVSGLMLSSMTAYLSVDSILARKLGDQDDDGNLVICEETILPGDAS